MVDCVGGVGKERLLAVTSSAENTEGITQTYAIKAATLIVRHFRKFGLTIHVGNRVEGSPSKTEALYVPSMCRGIKRYEDIPAEEVADIELVGGSHEGT